MRLVIIEDENRAAKRIEGLIKEINSDLAILKILRSVEESLQWFSVNPLPDLIISDIQLGDGRAFDVLEGMSEIPPVIFTTAYDEFAIRAFKNNGIDYLLKPIDKAELKLAVEKFLKLNKKVAPIDFGQLAQILAKDKPAYKERFIIKVGEKLKSIQSDEISCFYSLKGGTYLQSLEKRNYLIDYTLDQLEELMDRSKFFRINRKVMLSFSCIESIHTWSGSRLKLELSASLDELDDDMLVSRERVKDFKEWLDK
jgi:DNA-binding LytR/AlgR family response regulator